MLTLNLALIRIKQVFRSKEFFVYVMGFPLFFLVFLGFLTPGWVPRTTTIPIGVYYEGNPVVDEFTGETFEIDDSFVNTLETYNESGIKLFEVIRYENLTIMRQKILENTIRGGVEIPGDFSVQALNLSRFYAAMKIVDLLDDAIDEHPEDALNISSAINELVKYLNPSVNLTLRFHGDVSISDTMSAYSACWKILPSFIDSLSYNMTLSYWTHLKEKYSFDFTLNLTDKTSAASDISMNVVLIKSDSLEVVKNFEKAFYTRLIPGQIIQAIILSATNAVWIIDLERKTGLLKRMKLTRMTSFQYMTSMLIAWAIISLLQGIFMIGISILLGFIAFPVNVMTWLILLLTFILLGIMTATIALFLGSFFNAKVLTPFLILGGVVLSLIAAEVYFTATPVFSFMGRPFTVLDLLPMRSPFLLIQKGLLQQEIYSWTDLLPDITLFLLWTLIILSLSVYFFNKYKLQYVEKE